MRKRIMKAAMKLFLKRGYDNITMRSIASEIGYSPATIYRYFAHKDDIFFALRREGFARFYQAQMTARGIRDAYQRMRRQAEVYVTFALENPEYYDLMFLMRAPIERAAEREEWAESVKSLDLLREDVALAIEAGIIKDQNPEKVVFSIWSLLHGVVALTLRKRLASHLSIPEQGLVNQVVDFIFDNLIIEHNK